jgi:hypothetical protein
MQQENINTTQVCSTLFWKLSDQGLTPEDVNRLVKDIFSILRDGGTFTVGYINYELNKIGWYDGIVDENIVEMVLSILEAEFRYSVTTHTIH